MDSEDKCHSSERGVYNLNEIWRTCRKIQAAIFSYGINFWTQFKLLDPSENGVISESMFNHALAQYKDIIGLSEFEIKEVTDYFRLRDGRIAYDQFCKTICEEGQDHVGNENCVSGLEWDDPMHVNVISTSEERRLCLLLSKIAQTVRLKDIVLMPIFQDYELVAKNVGTVTIAHFSRVLHFLKILVSENDLLLLIKRYMKNSYTVNYVAFVKHIEEIVKYFDSKKLIDFSEDLIENFPGRLIDCMLPKILRPEVGKVNFQKIFREEPVLHSTFNDKIITRDIQTLMLRIKRHIYDNQIRIADFFEGYDRLRTSYITKNQFVRGLDLLGLSGLHRLYVSKAELDLLCDRYEDKTDINRVNWKNFLLDVDIVFTIRELEKKPFEIIVSPPKDVEELDAVGRQDWQSEPEDIRELCELALQKVSKRIKSYGLYLHQYFRAFDTTNIGHVSRIQARQVMYSNGILLSYKEFFALEKFYCDRLEFNYRKFLEDSDPVTYGVPKYETKSIKAPIKSTKECLKKPKPTYQSVIDAIANCKKQAVLKRVRIVDFIKTYDPLREEFVNEENFRRALSNANIKLSSDEMDIICELFRPPFRPGCVAYKRFCDVIEEAFYQKDLERAPLLVPLQHYPALECPACFLNFDERTAVSKALQKLSKRSDIVSNLLAIFQDRDPSKCGSVTQNQFLKALVSREMSNMISSHEFETICKCFGVERGFQMEFDYREFLRVLDVITKTQHSYPF